MSRSTISTFQLFNLYPDAETARKYLVYHHASKKHIGRYADEFTWRLNDGNVKRHSLDRLDSFVDAVAGKRLTYERLTR